MGWVACVFFVSTISVLILSVFVTEVGASENYNHVALYKFDYLFIYYY